jgi:hypothetical protein
LKKLLLLAVVAGAFLVGPGASSAFACVPVVTSNGEALTTLLYNPPAVTGPVNATGCDIAVYTDTGSTTINAANISGASHYGVFIDKGASATITNSSVHDIGAVPFNGAQYGVGIAFRAGSTGSIDNTSIYRFQKNGTVFSGAGTNVSITNSTVTGLGPVPYIAQNGIQYSDGAAGVARGNTVTDLYYTGCSANDAAKTGCVPYVSTAILLLDVDPKAVDTSNNKFRDDQRNLYVGPSASFK